MTVKIYSYNQGSEGAKNLSEAMDIRRIKHQGSKYRPRPGDTVINWGASRLPENLLGCSLVNNPSCVSENSNKLTFFTNQPDEILPEWTTDKETASGWLTEGHTVVCRTILNGHSGAGIELVTGQSESELPNAPLYTKYFKKKDEYRVHIVDGEVIDVQQKRRKRDVPDGDVNWRVRNLSGGFIYAREDVTPPDLVLSVAKQSFEASGLDFGAFDILWNEHERKAVVLEVNTAPGITGTTVEKYSEGLKNLLDKRMETC